MRYSIRPFRKIYGHTPAKAFGPLALRAIREHLIETGLCRTVINARIDRIRRVCRWAASVLPVLSFSRCRSAAKHDAGSGRPVTFPMLQNDCPRTPIDKRCR